MKAERRAGKKTRFVEALREHGIIGIAAKATGIHRSSIWRWMNEDPNFAEQVDDAREYACDIIEESLFTRAKNGDTIAQIFYLKARRPIFRDRLNIDVQAIDSEIEERMRQLGISDPRTAFAPMSPAVKLLEAPKPDDSTSEDLAQHSDPPEEEKQKT